MSETGRAPDPPLATAGRHDLLGPAKVSVAWTIRTLPGLTLPATPGTKSEVDIDKLIDDAVRQLHHRLRDDLAAGMVRTHNEDYGFARNLAGLRGV